MERFRTPPKPPEYMMNPSNHLSYIKDEKMLRIIDEISNFIKSTDAQRNIMCENILNILGVPEKEWNNPHES
jgi:hypothetical protein